MTVLYDPQVSAPRVYCREFSDNSIDFELRVFIQNINDRPSVRSRIRFSLDKTFRKTGIGTPFPQRVVYMPLDAVGPEDTDKNGETDR